jgi:hypothetical protein
MATFKETLPHIALIARADIKTKEFSAGLNSTINVFERRFNSWHKSFRKRYDEGNQDAINGYDSFFAESEILAQHIYDHFVEDDEQDDSASIDDKADQIKDAIIDDVIPVTEPVIEPVIPINEPIIEPVIPVTEPVIPVVEPIIEPVIPIVEPEKASSKSEQILSDLFKEGIVSGITKEILRAKGFDTSFWGDLSSTGQKCGKYRLSKKVNDELYNLEKI